MSPWEVVVHDAALREMQTFKRLDRAVFSVMVKRLLEIAEMPNPRVALDVCHLDWDAPGWYRLKITQPRHVRVIFRLLDHNRLEIGRYARVDTMKDEEKFLQICRATYRPDAYTENLHRRYTSIREVLDGV